MISQKECIAKLHNLSGYIKQNFGVSSMRLFGSVARGEQHEGSDVDVFVEMKPSLLKQVGLKQYLEEQLGCTVDVVRNHKNLTPFFLEEINHDAINIFN